MNIGVGCHFLSQGIFLTQGSSVCFLHWQVNSLPLSHMGSLKALAVRSYYYQTQWTHSKYFSLIFNRCLLE